MVLTFKDYQSIDNIDFDSMGEICEAHKYANSISSVMDKVTVFVRSNAKIYENKVKNIHFNRDEKIAVNCIFNEMLKQYEKENNENIAICETIINKGSLLSEGVEYDIDELLNEFNIFKSGAKWVKDQLKKGKEIISKDKEVSPNDTTEEIIDNTEKLPEPKGIDFVKAKKDDLVNWAKKAKKEFEDKYENLKKFINKLIKKSVDNVKDFINNILEVFSSLGDNLVDAVKKLGGLKMEKGEEPAKLEGIETDELYKNAKSDEEKSFMNNIINRSIAMLTKDKENTEKLMKESYDGMLEESIVDNKFIAWLSGYRNDGTKMSWWKCILIGLCASLIVWLLPHLLIGLGVGEGIAAFIAATVGVLWNGVGMLKLIYKRNKERKPGEKFFDKKTAIFFTLSALSSAFSIATFIKTIGPALADICNIMGWTGGKDMGKFGEFIFNLTKKFNPDGAFHDGYWKEWSENIKNHGGDFRGNDIIQSNKDAIAAMKEMPGASSGNVSAFDKFLSALRDSHGSSGVLKAAKAFTDDPNLPMTHMLDTSKWGGTAPIRQAIKELVDKGVIPDSAILSTGGSLATQKASKGVYGFCSFLTGLSKGDAMKVFARAAEIAGKDASQLHIETFGKALIKGSVIRKEWINGFWDVLAGNVYTPVMVPFFDEKKWGKYKMRFGSATRGGAAYVVEKVEMLPGDKIEGDENSKALTTLKTLHKNAWEEYKKKFGTEVVEEGFFSSKKDKKDKKVEEPQYIVFYINDSLETGNKEDKAEKADSEKSEDKAETAIGVVIDTLTMMVADVCNFNKSVEVRRRPQPYFMKGLLSRLSFRPLENNDNETKDYIRTTLGQTMKTLITQNTLFGMGKKYIEAKDEDKTTTFELREKVFETEDKVNGDKAIFELGNFTPNELLQCLNDDSKTNKVSYDFLDGKYGSKVSIKLDGNGDVTSTKATKDASTIENIKYYRVPKKSYKEQMDNWNKDVEKWKKNKADKKPKKPTFIKGDDGEYYKRASKKFMAENKRKKFYDFVDIRIIPLLKKGELHKELIEHDKIKKMLYTEDEDGNVKLHKEVITVLKPFLYRPEKTFAKDDEHELKKLLNEQGVEGEKLGWFKNLFKDEEQLHNTFKELVEIIWDYLSENRRKIFKNKDLKPTHGKTNESYDDNFTLFDELIEEFFNDEYDEDTEYAYDMNIINEEKPVLSFEDFLFENY